MELSRRAQQLQGRLQGCFDLARMPGGVVENSAWLGGHWQNQCTPYFMDVKSKRKSSFTFVSDKEACAELPDHCST